MPITIQQIGPSCLLISWENKITSKTSREVYHFNRAILKAFKSEIVDSVPAYCSLTLFINHSADLTNFINQLFNIYNTIDFSTEIISRHWNVPVCYHPSLGFDLGLLSSILNLSIDEIILLHCTPLYTVDFIGFLPGFPYLSGLNKILQAPRLSSPRTLVNDGSVAIGGKQTGIYPVSSPAGWNIIGRTRFKLFNVNDNNPCPISPMDTLQFKPITLSEFNTALTND